MNTSQYSISMIAVKGSLIGIYKVGNLDKNRNEQNGKMCLK